MKDDSFSIDVIRRILEVLSNEGNTKRTALAGKTGLNYAALIRYLKFLQRLKWIDFVSESGGMISITQVGRSFRSLLDSGEPKDISDDVLDKLLAQSSQSRVSVDNGNLACLFCGNVIRGRAITREMDDKTYSFDKIDCATFFMKLRDVYGKESLI